MASLCRWSSVYLSSTIRWQSLRSPLARCCRGLPHGRQMSLSSRVKGAFKTPESEVLDKITSVPFYELSNPPLPIQLNWLFLFLDAVFTGAGVALAWRYWTYKVPGDEEGAPPKSELRPANQRLALACLHIGIGSVVALRLINVRRSYVRKLWLFPGSVPANYRRATVLPSLDTTVVENYSLFNPRVEFTLERNAYRFTAHKQDAMLRLTPPGGREDGFVLLTEGVQIDGKPVSRDEALREILNPFQQSKTKVHSKKKKRSTISTAARVHVSSGREFHSSFDSPLPLLPSTMPIPYLPHILYSTALTSVSIHLLWQRTTEKEDRARYHAQVTILEDLAQQLRSGVPITDEEINRLKNLARVHGQGEGQKQSTEAIRWSEVVWGKKAADSDQKTE